MSYDAFMRDLNAKSDVLSILYHVLLLTEVGLKSNLIDFETNKSMAAADMKRTLTQAGLLMPINQEVS